MNKYVCVARHTCWMFDKAEEFTWITSIRDKSQLQRGSIEKPPGMSHCDLGNATVDARSSRSRTLRITHYVVHETRDARSASRTLRSEVLVSGAHRRELAHRLKDTPKKELPTNSTGTLRSGVMANPRLPSLSVGSGKGTDVDH